MYLTARPIGQAHFTKSYIFDLLQDGEMMPEGPVIMSPDRMLRSGVRELVIKKPHIFKIGTLGNIRSLFP